MRTYDLSPLFRHSVGFDHLARMLDGLQNETAPSYPPYNIEHLDADSYRISMAVAGFGEGDLDIVVQENTLRIAGKIAGDKDEQERVFLHRGIAERAFERRFKLADHIRVEDAQLENGLLHISLKREIPEEAKPRNIAVKTVGGPARRPGKVITGKAA